MASRELKVEIIGDASSLNRALGSASKASSGTSKAFGKLAKAGVLAGAALGAGVVVGIKKSIDAASNLTEQVNKTNVVFKGSQEQVIAWSKGLESSFGLSQRAALEAAGTFGNMLVPMGFARDAAGQMSEKMVELAGDMASFNNASPEDTLLAIRSGLAGEAEPLRKYGVFLSEVRVQQEALSETGKKNVKQLTLQEKAVARYNLILKDTKDTQGDFARSAGTSLANQMRILRASFEDVQASLGSIFLPMIIKVFGFINEYAIPALQEAVDWLAKFSKQLGKAKGVAKVQVVITGIKEIANKFVSGLIAAITALLPQKPIKFVPKIDEPGLETVGGGVDWDAVANDMLTALGIAFQQSTTLAKSLATTIVQSIRAVDWNAVGREMGPGLAAAVAVAITTALDPAFWIKNWDLALAIALTIWGGALAKEAVPFASALGKTLVGVVERISPEFAAAMGRLIADAVKVILAVWARGGKAIFDAVKAQFLKIGSVAIFTVKVLGIVAVINALGDLAGAAYAKAQAIAKSIAGGIAAGWHWIVEQLKKLPNAIADAAKAAVTAAERLGQNIIHGIVRGLAGLPGAIKEKVESAIGWAFSHINVPGGSPPEHAAAEMVGKPLAEGVVIGFVEGIRGFPSSASQSMKSALVETRAAFIEASKVLGRGGALAIVEGFRTQEQSLAQQIRSALVQATKDALAAARQAVLDAKSVFASAFDQLASTALEAFDRVSSQFETKTEKKIRTQDEQRAAADRQKALDAANEAVRKANEAINTPIARREGESPEEFAQRQAEAVQAAVDDLNAALQQQADAAFAIQRAKDEKAAEQERKQYEASRERRRVNFENQMQDLEKQLETGHISARKFRQKLLALFEKFDVPFKNAGNVLGAALSAGLHESFDDAAKAARALIEAIAKELKKIKLVVSVDVTASTEEKKTKGMQHGGPVRRGNPYIVGEAGPELFIPSRSGMIAPAMAGGGTAMAEIHTNVYLDGVKMTELIRREMLRFEKRNGRPAV